jgi:hypothetical protein
MIGARKVPRAGGSATVSIHVRDLSQLFNSFDPSPFWDRDLDQDAARFIEEEFSEKRATEHWHLHVHAQGGEGQPEDLQKAVKSYYTRLASSARRQLREQMRFSQLVLLGGLVVFAICMGLRQLLQASVQQLPRAVDEGLIILAWLALWRPAEAIAYEWIPLYRRRRLYDRLAAVKVSVRIKAREPVHVGEAG